MKLTALFSSLPIRSRKKLRLHVNSLSKIIHLFVILVLDLYNFLNVDRFLNLKDPFLIMDGLSLLFNDIEGNLFLNNCRDRNLSVLVDSRSRWLDFFGDISNGRLTATKERTRLIV